MKINIPIIYKNIKIIILHLFSNSTYLDAYTSYINSIFPSFLFIILEKKKKK
jgi:hypothetical protein